MKFKIGDKVIVNEKILIKSGLGQLKIKQGIVTEFRGSTFIRVKRGKDNTWWHEDFWRKTK